MDDITRIITSVKTDDDLYIEKSLRPEKLENFIGQKKIVENLDVFIKSAKKQKAGVIFAQPQFDRNTAQKIASAINGVVMLIDPLAYDYIANMEKIADTITGTLKN